METRSDRHRDSLLGKLAAQGRYSDEAPVRETALWARALMLANRPYVRAQSDSPPVSFV